MKGIRLLVILVLAQLIVAMPGLAEAGSELDCPNGRVLVGFKPHSLTELTDKLTKNRKVKGSIRHRRVKAANLILDQRVGKETQPNSEIDLGPSAFALDLVTGSEDVSGILSKLEAKGDIRYAECDENIELFADVVPNDPYYRDQHPDMWGLRGKPGGIDTQLAWNVTTGSSNVVVAVIDTGIDYNHPDLAPNMWRNPGEIAADGIDNDSNGFVDDVYGVDRVNYDSDPWDDHYHGTHCAGTIGAAGNNGVGVVGVNWNVKLMAVKVLAASGSGSYSGIAEGVDYVVNSKLRGAISNVVMSASLGGTYRSQALKDSLERARNNGILLAAAAGNSSQNINRDSPYRSYPASFSQELSNIVSVAALTSTGGLSYFSNYGVQDVHIAAPGSYILSTKPGNSYQSLSGTSMATPHVAGVLALMLAANPTINMTQLRAKLLEGSYHNSMIDGYVEGGRMLDANGAVRAAGNGVYKVTGKVAAGSTGVARVTMSLTSTTNSTRLSDSQGNYSFEGLPIGAQYTVTPTSSCATFSPLAASGTIASADVVHNFAATLQTLTVSGVIRDPGKGNSAISGVLVADSISGRSATSDSNGNYSISGLTCGSTYSLSATKTGYTFSGQSGNLDNNVSVNFVPSGATYSLSGRVLDSNGAPLSSVAITIRHNNFSTEQVLTNSQGGYTISVVMPDTITITPSKGGYSFLPISSNRVVSGDLTQDFTGSIVYYSISGTIALNGAPVAGISVVGDNALGSVTTDSNGTYRFSGVRYGQTYTIAPSDPRYSFSPGSASGTVSTNVTNNFSATVRTFSVRGHISDDIDNNLSGVRVTCGTQVLTSGADGNFVLNGLTYGQNYSCTLSKVGYLITPAVVSGSATADVNASAVGELQYYTLSGVVTVNGQPVAGVTVSEPRLGIRLTDASGGFSFGSVPANTRYTLRASKSGHVITPGIQTGVVLAQTTVNFSAALSNVTISGVVTQNGQPLAGVRIQSDVLGAVSTDSNGQYSFSGVRGGTSYVLSASKTGLTFTPETVSGVANDSVTHDFSASGQIVTVSGRLVSKGQPVVGVTVKSAALGTTVSGSDGTFSFPNVTYGTKYDLAIQSPGYTARAITKQEALSDRSHTLSLTPNRFTISGRVYNADGGGLARAVVTSNFGGKRVTGTNGSFTISAVPYNFALSLKANKKGLTFETMTIVVTGTRSLKIQPK